MRAETIKAGDGATVHHSVYTGDSLARGVDGRDAMHHIDRHYDWLSRDRWEPAGPLQALERRR